MLNRCKALLKVTLFASLMWTGDALHRGGTCKRLCDEAFFWVDRERFIITTIS